jgi:hypothetical protein
LAVLVALAGPDGDVRVGVDESWHQHDVAEIDDLGSPRLRLWGNGEHGAAVDQYADTAASAAVDAVEHRARAEEGLHECS